MHATGEIQKCLKLLQPPSSYRHSFGFFYKTSAAPLDLRGLTVQFPGVVFSNGYPLPVLPFNHSSFPMFCIQLFWCIYVISLCIFTHVYKSIPTATLHQQINFLSHKQLSYTMTFNNAGKAFFFPQFLTVVFVLTECKRIRAN